MLPRPGAWGVSAIPTASVALSVGMLGVMALQLSHPHAAKTKASERSGMELRLESSALRDGIDATAQFFKAQRMVACCGDRFTLACLAWRSRFAVPWLVPPPLKRRVLSWCCATSRAC